MGWKTKAFVQGVLSRLPNGRVWNQAIQRHITKSLVLDEKKFRAKLELGRTHLKNFVWVRGAVSNFSVLELGTGRFPVVPLCMFLCGAERVVSLDVAGLLRDDTVKETLQMFADLLAVGALPGARPERMQHLRQTVAEFPGLLGKRALQRFGIETIVGDVGRSGLPPASFDLLVSNNTLEHISRGALLQILKTFRRLARSDAVMSHFIDLRDHYAEFDRSINVYNYLRYSEHAWRWFNNSLQYQNRLRVSDYRALHELAGWRVVFERNDAGSLCDLRSIPIWDEFQKYSEEELSICCSWMVSRAAVRAPRPAARDLAHARN